MDFLNWLRSCTKRNGEFLSERTINKYHNGVITVSNDMIKERVIDKNLKDMDLIELDIAIALINKNNYFLNKDSIGHKMYSNSLKRYRCYKYFSSELGVQEIEEEVKIKKDKNLSLTEKETLIKARIGQGVFRKKILQKYKCCIITKIDINQCLIASHIKPWAVCDNDEKLNENNGLLLSATYDKLFDSGLISFNKNGRILISSLISYENIRKLNLEKKKYDIGFTEGMKVFLAYHNNFIFIK